ncbi:MAG: HAD family hydrolase [Acidobacteria bacterium]|nr:MAG: HAD family hydrolase [Acidobacteriota bacterium]
MAGVPPRPTARAGRESNLTASRTICAGGSMTATTGRDVRVVCFDVDGTLVRQPEGRTIWQIINAHYHGGDEINRRRFRAFREGLISYPEWVTLDILDWKAHGARRGEIEALIRRELTVVPGARETVAELKRRGYGTAVVSGTLDLVFELLLSDFPFDHVYTNRIFFDEEGRIAGFEPTPYDVEGKADGLARVARDFGVRGESIAFVGDSWNDRAAFRAAGFAVAYHPKDPGLVELADAVVQDGSFERLLDLFPGSEAA